MNNLIVVGASGHAKLVIDTVEKEGKHRIAGLLSRHSEPGSQFFGYPVLGREEDLPELVARFSLDAGIVAIGDNWTRGRVVRRIRELAPAVGFVSAVHPSAQIARGVEIGQGVVIMAGAIANGDARIGDFSFLSTKSSLDHDSALEDFASLGPGAITGGSVTIERFSAVCLGASVIHGINIGEHAVVGAGSTVVEDVPGYSVAYGTPARVIRPREAGETYL